ncbi:M23 family metallopeptidase [Cytobacillus kochii]
MTFDILFLLFIQFVLPVVFSFSLWKGKLHSKLDWLLQATMTGLLILWLFFSSPWDLFSYYLRFLILVFFIVALFLSWKKVNKLPFKTEFNLSQKISMAIYGLLILVFGYYNVSTFSGFSTNMKAVQLDFPLQDGVYYVGQGGSHVQINYHHAHESQAYAVDVVKLNALGSRATGIYPNELDKYEIFGDELTSPCTGEVVQAENDLADLVPPDADPKNAAGNSVVISCEGVEVLLAHMQEGSVRVQSGDRVEVGEPIGLVGNSGNTSEPHLHIHAEKDGKGVPIEFDGRFLVRNSIVW